MKCLLLLLALGLVLCKAQAQSAIPTAPGQLTFSITPGVAIPIGKFAWKDYTEAKSGFARPGPDAVFRLGYQIAQHFGVTVEVAGTSNAFDNSVYNNWMASMGSDLRIRDGQYEAYRVMAGPNFNYPIGKRGKWELTAQLLGGYLHILETHSYTYTTTGRVPVSPQSDTFQPAFAFEGGAGVRYWTPGRAFYLLGGINLLASSYRGTNYSDPTLLLPPYVFGKAPLTTLDVDLGAGLRF